MTEIASTNFVLVGKHTMTQTPSHPTHHTHLQAEKVEYISQIKEISNNAARNAEMSLFCRQPVEAEGILLQGGLIYRAIRLNIDLYKWSRWACG